jgi:hypothetical protein
MGTLEIGHGSEFHLLRFLGRHRDLLGAQIRAQLSDDGVSDLTGIEWLDFSFNPRAPSRDGEILSVDFLRDHGDDAWTQFWPDRRPGSLNRSGMPSWDAVARIRYADSARDEWLLVEAKAHLGEFASPQSACGAGGKSRQMITNALRSTFEVLRPTSGAAWESVEGRWLGRYYQLANRLAVLHFLQTQEHAARLLYLLFAGDTYRVCPAGRSAWATLFTQAYKDMGIEAEHLLSTRCHRLCMNVMTGKRV